MTLSFKNSIVLNVLSLLFILAITYSVLCHPLYAAESDQANDEATAALFGDTVIPITTFGRQARPLNHVAENVTVITREDIDRLQAQSLADVLQYYTGVLPYPSRYSFDLSVPMVQGLPNRQTLVTLDGIPLNNGSDGIIDISTITTGFLDRIEIVKGPAASMWGRSVGAIINLISRDPSKDRMVGGFVRGSLGTKQSGEGEVLLDGYSPQAGTGYILATAGNRTHGFQPGINGYTDSYYGKLKQDIGAHTELTGIFGKAAGFKNIINSSELNARADNDFSTYYGTARLQHQFAPGSDLEAQMYLYSLHVDTNYYNLAAIPPFIPVSGIKLQSQGIREETEGFQLSYKKTATNYWFTLGLDATQGSLRNSNFSLIPPPTNTHTTKYPYNVAEYLSAGYEIDKFTLTASYRFDWYSLFDNTHSPNIGAIYKATEKTLIRASYGYGYSLPSISSGSTSFETLWRAQVGVETNDIPLFWFKANGFYDRMKNVQLQLKFFDNTPEIDHALTREGFEIEAKSVPFLNTSFGLGYTYAHIFNSDTGAEIQGLPRHQLLLSANYRAHGTDASLYARYINFNTGTSNDQVVWDFLLTQRIYSWNTGNANLTFSARNLFNASQQPSSMFPNPPLRIDAGFKVNF